MAINRYYIDSKVIEFINYCIFRDKTNLLINFKMYHFNVPIHIYTYKDNRLVINIKISIRHLTLLLYVLKYVYLPIL